MQFKLPMLDRRTARLDSAAEVDLSTSIAGRPSSLPFGISPTGFARFMHSEGEDAVAPAAAKAGILFSLSPMDTRSVKEVARVPALYLWKDREASKDLLERAQKGSIPYWSPWRPRLLANACVILATA